MNKHKKKIIAEDGSEYYGYSFGAEDNRVLELVFNTSVVGYQEIFITFETLAIMAHSGHIFLRLGEFG